MKPASKFFIIITGIIILFPGLVFSQTLLDKKTREEKKKIEIDETQKEFAWWPTDATPAPVKDNQSSGYWWNPKTPGSMRPWGNRGYLYVYKIIYNYKDESSPAELRPSLLIKKIIRNVKIYFDYDSASIRKDAADVLKKAVNTLNKNPETSILITGNCDIRGSEAYNEKLGKHRAESVRNFMLKEGVLEDKIKIISRGKLDAVAHIADIEGMQKDRNAQFVIAEVQEIMLPAQEAKELVAQEDILPTQEGNLVVEKEEILESEPKISQKEYTIKKGDSLWKIAAKQLGSGHRWKYLYEINKKVIKNPAKLKAGQKIIIPLE